MPAGGLREAGLGEHAERDAPEDRNPLVDLRLHASHELLVAEVLHPHLLHDLRLHCGVYLPDVDGVASHEALERQFALALGLRRLVVLLDVLLYVLEGARHRDYVLIAEPAFRANRLDGFLHFVYGSSAARRRAGRLRDLVLVDGEAVVPENALARRRRAVALLPLVHHRHAVDPDISVGVFLDVRLRLRLGDDSARLRGCLLLRAALRVHRNADIVCGQVLRLHAVHAPDEIYVAVALVPLLRELVAAGLELLLRRVRADLPARLRLRGDVVEKLPERFRVEACGTPVVAPVVERHLDARRAVRAVVYPRLPHLEPVPRAGVALHAVDDVALLAREAEAVPLVVHGEVNGRLRPGVRLCEVRPEVARGKHQRKYQREHGVKSTLL